MPNHKADDPKDVMLGLPITRDMNDYLVQEASKRMAVECKLVSRQDVARDLLGKAIIAQRKVAANAKASS